MSRLTCCHCNQSTVAELALCQHCNTALYLEALAGVDPTSRFRSKYLAQRYSMMLGTFGVHKFYLGEPIRGGLYLAFSWTLVPTVLGIIDSVKMAKMAPEQFEQRWRCVTQTS